jgi:hypothetical protein
MKQLKYLFLLYSSLELLNIYKQYKRYQNYKPVVPSRQVPQHYTDMVVSLVKNDSLIFNKLMRIYGDKNKITYTDIFNMLYHIIFCKLYKSYIPTDIERNTVIEVMNTVSNKTQLRFNIHENSKQKGVYYGNEPIFFLPALISMRLIYSLLHLKKYIRLKYHGFCSTHIDNSIIAYHKIHKSDKKKLVIFIHGLGFGIMPYVNFINKISEQFTVVAFELPNVSKNKTHYPNPPHEQIVGTIIKYLDTNFPGYSKDIITHSYGTTFMKAFIESNHKFDKVILVDPMCFYQTAFTSAKYFCSNFFDKLEQLKQQYKKIKLKTFIFHTLLHFVVFDIDTQYICKRQVWGVDKWIDDKLSDRTFCNNILITLAQNEYFYNSTELKNFINNAHPTVNVIHNKSRNHGDIIYDERQQQDIIAYLQSNA